MRYETRGFLICVALLAVVIMATLCMRPSIAANPMDTPVTPGQLEIRGTDGKPAGACPLKHTDVDVQISGFIARVNVVQQFQNPTNQKIEAVYTFPLAEDSAVDRMEMKVGKRTIVGEIHRREEAKQIYEEAKQAGHVACLLDQERPNIFTQSIANIEPGEAVTITISYTQLLKYEAGIFSFSFPTVVGPRYNPGAPVGHQGTGAAHDTTEVPDASKISPPITPKATRAGHDISIKVDINNGIPIYSAKCETHDVNVKYPDKTSAVITLKDKATIPNKDFVLKYEVAGEQINNGLITHAPVAGKGGWFSLVMMPPKAPKAAQITPKEMVFVIDISGSQQGEPLAKSKETMLHCIRNVNPGDTFNMITFSNSVSQLFESPQPYNAENLAKAEEFLKKCEAGGGTEMLPALKAALEPAADPKRLRIVVFFSDGFVGNDFQLVDCVQKNVANARMFTFGIGNGVNRFLMEKMAEVGKGSADIVLLNSDSKNIAEKFYDRIRSPLLTDITVDWNGLPVATDELYPCRIPDLFASQPLILKGRFTCEATGSITVRGKLGGKPWSNTFQVELPATEVENDSLSSIWARSKVEDLMSKDWLGAQNGNAIPDIKEKITQIALDYSLMTQYTSFVAVDKSKVTAGGDAKTVAVPVKMPEGVNHEGIAYDYSGVSMGSMMATAPAPASAGLGRRKVSTVPSRGSISNSKSEGIAAGIEAHNADANGNFIWPDGVGEARPFDLDNSIITKGDEKSVKKFNLIVGRLDKTLVELVVKFNKAAGKGNFSVPGKLVVKDGKVQVVIRVTSAKQEEIAKLKALGLTSSVWSQKKTLLTGWVPVANLSKIAQLDFVTKITPPIYARK